MGTSAFPHNSTYDPRLVPPPPRLHWGLVLALQILTFGLFGGIWLIVQALWAKRLSGNGRALTWAIVNLVALPVAVVIAAVLRSGGAARLLLLALNLTAVFTLRSQLESFPIGMSLSGGLTFLLGPVYFQYHMNNYVLPGAEDVFGPSPDAPAYVPATYPEVRR